MKAGDRVRTKARLRQPFGGKEGTLIVRAGLIVPGPAWWVKLDDDSLNDEKGQNLFDEDELEVIT